MIILGIDPGTIKVGFGLIEVQGNQFRHIAHGVIKPPAKAPVHQRLKFIFQETSILVGKFSPDKASIENAFVGKNVQSTLRIGEGRGALLTILAMNNLDIVSFSPKEIKKAVTGTGTAHKTQVQAMVKTLLGLSAIPEPDDAADALAMAICAANHQPIKYREG